LKPSNITHYVNHFGLFLDASGSMKDHVQNVIKVADNQIAFLAQRSKELDQETRISLYSFSGYNEIHNLLWDMDVLRMPSIAGLYRATNQTALMDATHKVIDDFLLIPTMYDDHAIYLLGISDGYENNSKKNIPSVLRSKIDSLPENWTLGLYVPDINSKAEASRFGFQKDNIELWDTSKSFETEIGESLRQSADMFMTGRPQGVRGYNAKTGKSLFKLNTVSVSEIQRHLVPVNPSQYQLLPVRLDSRIDDFVVQTLGVPYKIGKAYYQLTKKETIQPQKEIALLANGRVYVGAVARSMLGLPSVHVDVKPDDYADYVIFVQSTSINRKLIQGTSLLYSN
jgi:hypothetical protein